VLNAAVQNANARAMVWGSSFYADNHNDTNSSMDTAVATCSCLALAQIFFVSEPAAAILPAGQRLNPNQPLDPGKIHLVNCPARPKP